jgi:hypothetical protein
MRMISIGSLLLVCGLATAAYGQYALRPSTGPDTTTVQPAPPQSAMTLAQKCALASGMIKSNNCGPQGCDIGLCVALQNGCRINHWGHSCPWTGSVER